MADGSGVNFNQTHSGLTAPSMSAAGGTYDDQLKSFNEFWNYLQDLLGTNKFSPTSVQNNNYIKSALAVLNKFNVQQDTKTGFVYLNNIENKSSIEITPNSVVFISKNIEQEFTMESAMAMAWAAAQNKTILEKGIVLQGTDKQKEMLLLAIVAANKILPPEQQLSVKNPVPYNTINVPDFQSYIDKNVSGLTSHAPQPSPAVAAASQEPQAGAQPDPNAKPYGDGVAETLLKAKISGLTKALEGQDEKTLRAQDRLIGTRATNEGQNVYKVANSKKGLEIFYVIKDQKPVIIRLDEKGSNTFRHETIRMKNDEGHPNYKAPKSATPDFVKAAKKFDLPIFKLGKPAFDMPEATQNSVTAYDPNLVIGRKMPDQKDLSSTTLMTLGQAFPKSPVIPPEISGQSHMPIVRENAFAKAVQESFFVSGETIHPITDKVQKLSEASGGEPFYLTIKPL